MKFFGLNLNTFRPLAWSAAVVGTPANTNETVLKTYTIPADFLNADGKRIRAKFWGAFANNANNKTLSVRLGPVTLTGTVIFTIGPTAFNNTDWMIQTEIVRRVVDSQTCISLFNEDGTIAANICDIQENVAANDDSTAMLLELTGTNAVATANDVTARGHFIEYIAQP